MSLHATNPISRTLGFAVLGAAWLFLAQAPRAAAQPALFGVHSFVYVMGNQAADNTILVFRRNPDGSLNQVQEVSTQGKGTGGGGDPLGSQGALTLTDDGRLLLASDAGSNQVSSFAVTEGGLQFAGVVSSGGTMPVSIAVRGDTAYVLNAGGTPNVTAFRIRFNGTLTMIPGSTLPVAGGVGSGPAQVGITPDGEVLVVSEKNTAQFDLFPIDDPGEGASSTAPSNGPVPFGFAFGRNRTLVVSEAANSTISSYRVGSVENAPTL